MVLLCVLTRLPAFRYGVISDDEGIYYAMARVVNAGGVMYRDTVDHKPPGIVYTYAAALWMARALGGTEKDLGIHLVHFCGLIFVFGSCLVLYAIARRILVPSYSIFPTVLYALSSAAKQPVDGLAVNGELLMNLPIALAVWCAIEARDRRRFLDVVAGIFCGIATLYKYQAAILFVAMPMLLLGEINKKRFRTVFSSVLMWGAGFVTPIVLMGAYFYHRDALGDALRWGVRFNTSYIAQGPPWSWALKRLSLQLVGVVLPSFVLYTGGLISLLRLIRGKNMDDFVTKKAFLAAWSLASLMAVGVGRRFFGHYFLQPELTLALLAAGFAFRLGTRRGILCLGVPSLLSFVVAIWPEMSQPILNSDDPDFRLIGRTVAARTAPSDTIWVWGNVPQIYYYADRRPGVRFTFCNYLTGLSPATPSEELDTIDPRANALLWAWPMVFEDLERQRPKWLLDTAAGGIKSYGKFPIESFPAFASYVSSHYRREDSVGDAVFYRRLD